MRVFPVVALVGLTVACVSQDKFRKKQVEAEQLRARSAELDAALAASKADAAASKADLDKERERSAGLQAKVDELSRSKNSLESAKADLEKKSGEYEKMASALKKQIETGRIELTELRGKMTVKMKDKILFSSGSATIGKEGKDALRSVAEVLRGVEGKTIRVEGHTDNVPLGRGASTWDLSTARARAVLRFLQECGVDPTRMAAAGYGEYQPIAANDTPEGRSLNRRIEIVLAASEKAETPAAPKK